jgi:hypothetical protein
MIQHLKQERKNINIELFATYTCRSRNSPIAPCISQNQCESPIKARGFDYPKNSNQKGGEKRVRKSCLISVLIKIEEGNIMKKWKLILITLLFFSFVAPAIGADFTFHGDMNNRFLVYTNHTDWLNARDDSFGVINDNKVEETYAELKYRFWTEISDDDDNIKGVYAIEIGGIRWGRRGSGKSEGGSFSGDGANLETRWAYLDFQLPFVERKARTRMGLQPFKANSFFWQETATALDFSSSITDTFDYELAWIRSVDKFNDITDNANDDIEDVDSFYGRVNFKPTDTAKIGLWGLYMTGDGDVSDPASFASIDPRDYELKSSWLDDADVSIYTIGTDGSASFGNFFVNWDLMYQGGDIDDVDFLAVTPGTARNSGAALASGDFDLSAYLLHADVGYKLGKTKFTYTFWYSSGDDDPNDNDFGATMPMTYHTLRKGPICSIKDLS